MTTIDTVVVGAGHAGLAVSKLLTDAGRDHVVLDRGRIADRWRTERWDSLHLLTPSWMTRLPGWSYTGPDPDGFLSAGSLRRPTSRRTPPRSARRSSTGRPCTRSLAAPGARRPPLPRRHRAAAPGTPGTSSSRRGRTGRRTSLRASPGSTRDVDVSPRTATAIPPPRRRRRARRRRLGVRPADRRRAQPRRSRGHDRRRPARPDARAATAASTSSGGWRTPAGWPAPSTTSRPRPRAETSLQLVGRDDPERATQDLDLGGLQERGVRLVGRVDAVEGRRPACATTSPPPSAPADAPCTLPRQPRPLRRAGRPGRAAVGQPAPGRSPSERPDRLDLRAEGIGTVLVAAGYRPHHPWLRLPITDADGTIRQHRGVTPRRGLYVVGQRFQHRRDSGYIDGARHDAAAVVAHLLAERVRRARRRPAPRSRGMSRLDVVVVGGRVAGASTALLLARAGLWSRSLDRGRRERHPSTHALMRAGVLQLSRWGVLGESWRRAPGDPGTVFHPPTARTWPSPSARARGGRAATHRAGRTRPTPRRGGRGRRRRCCTRRR